MNHAAPRSYAHPATPTQAAVTELRAFLAVADAALRVLEQTAWETRRLADELATAARRDLALADAERQELASAVARGARAARCAWVLGKIVASYRLHLTRAAFSTRASAGRALDRLHAKKRGALP